MKNVFVAFVIGMIVMGASVFAYVQMKPDILEPRDEPTSEIHRGPLRRTETIAIGEVVNGVHNLNRLVVFQAYVTAQTTTHDIGWLTQTDQTMLTPAFVNYYMDMDSIGKDQIRVEGNTVFVPRPAIIIERPNIDTRNVQVFSNGIWSVLSAETDRLRVENNKMALDQLVERAKMPFLIEGAKKAATIAEESNIRKALVASGHGDVTVHVGH